ncbi:hypothetical protein [Paludibacterium paludis]|uniref:Uncharacterized protein n=1 Tax=Paludibacterium paludis TaxID=1225769 RepID=A0A918U818_9NEIS|nr:hypothetical protein [Paludibacterium paludis]GGY09476.1 hypothetical protein GCM10011289_10320 [Paludibacterium paludis]
MKQQPRFDIDLDKHYNATLVIACSDCGRETRLHMKTLIPDRSVHCQCGSPIAMSPGAMLQAERRVDAIKAAYRVR